MSNYPTYKELSFCIYARKSQKRKDKQIISIESQIEELIAYAKKAGIKVVKIYTEAASAYTPDNRPVFNQMMKDAEKGEFNAVLTWKADRLSRNMVEAGKISYMLQTGVLELIKTPVSQYYSSDNVLMLILEMGVATQLSRDISRNTKRGSKTRIQMGGFCSKAPIGYLNQQKKKVKSIVKDPETFDKVKKLFALCATGKYNLSELSELAYKKLELVGNVKKKQLRYSSIHKILINPFYYGKVRCGELENKGTHPAMLSYDEFEKVQRTLRTSVRSAKTRFDFPYTGLIHCGECACPITAEEKVKYNCPKCNKKQTAKKPKKCACGYLIQQKDVWAGKAYTYYHCTKSKGKCTQKAVNASVLETGFKGFIENLQVDNDFMTWANQWLDFVENEFQVEALAEQKDSSKRIEQLEKKIGNLLDLRIANEINDKTYQKKKKALEDEKLKYNHTNSIEVKKNALQQELNFLCELSKAFENASPKEKKHLLFKIASNPSLIDKKLLVQAKKHYLQIQTLRKHKNLQIEPPKNHSQSGLNGLQEECLNVWYPLLDQIETISKGE